MKPKKELVDAALKAARHQHIFVPGTSGIHVASVLAEEVVALRDKRASVDTEANRVFTLEFQAELRERTADCDKLCEERDMFSAAQEAAERTIVELKAELARAEVAREGYIHFNDNAALEIERVRKESIEPYRRTIEELKRSFAAPEQMTEEAPKAVTGTEQYEVLLQEQDELRAGVVAWRECAGKRQATIERVEALCDDVDAKYVLRDDNSADENRGKLRLFLALDDVRAALRGFKPCTT